jgi:hypothetical protein
LLIEMGKPYQLSRVLYMDDLQKSTEELMSYREAGGGGRGEKPNFENAVFECAASANDKKLKEKKRCRSLKKRHNRRCIL